MKHGPVILRLRTANRTDQARLPSLTPVWRGAEFQEREIYDLYGIIFEDHPDLRRILMWDGFKDFPMRKDYVEQEDYHGIGTTRASPLDAFAAMDEARKKAREARGEKVVPQVSRTPGFVAGYWVGLDGGRGTSVIVFESEDAARSAAAQAQAPGDFLTFDSIEVGEVVANA